MRHTFAWSQEHAPLLWVEMIYLGDVDKMKSLLGYAFGGHYFTSTNQVTSCYLNVEKQKEAEQIGAEKYRDPNFRTKIIQLTLQTAQEVERIAEIIQREPLQEKTPKELHSLLNKFFHAYAALAGVYRFTRPTFYDGILKEIEKEIPAPKERYMVLLLENKFSDLPVQPSAEVQQLAKDFKHIGERRFSLHGTYQRTYTEAKRLFAEIGKRIGVSGLEVENCTLSEIGRALMKHIPIDIAEVRKRVHFFKFIYHDDSFEIVTTQDRGETEIQEAVELKGQVANPGHAKGKAKVIVESLVGVSSEEMQKMQEGDILIATSTSPDMMPAIRKARAIVADAGGLLSHAAIVSREFDIPYIVDTRIATKVFKDGDLVEVDAENGVVRKIE